MNSAVAAKTESNNIEKLEVVWCDLGSITTKLQDIKALLYQRSPNSEDDRDKLWRRLDEIQIQVERAHGVVNTLIDLPVDCECLKTRI